MAGDTNLRQRCVPDAFGAVLLLKITVFTKAGSDVTVIERLDRALPQYDQTLTEVVQQRATDLGVGFEFGETASDWSVAEKGLTLVTEDRDGATTEYEAEKCLVAVGRAPVTDGQPDICRHRINDERFFIIDDCARTSLDDIYAVGDAAGEPMLEHEGMMEGEVAAEVIAANLRR